MIILAANDQPFSGCQKFFLKCQIKVKQKDYVLILEHIAVVPRKEKER
jgi:hypothetical protein